MLMTFSLNAFAAPAATLHAPYDVWIKTPLFIQFWNKAFGTDEYWWSIDAAGSTIYVAQAINIFYNSTNHITGNVKKIIISNFTGYGEFKESLTISIRNGISVFWIIG